MTLGGSHGPAWNSLEQPGSPGRGYGCRVIQRLIEYCASVQISALLDEVLQCCALASADPLGIVTG